MIFKPSVRGGLLSVTLTSLYGTLATAQRKDGQYWPCNPTVNATGSCTPNTGLNSAAPYTVDFTKLKGQPTDWTSSIGATITYPGDASGASFTFAKPADAPQLWTDFTILFGHVEAEVQVAPGIGMISSMVLISDDFDEIDWEWSGNNFGNPAFAAGEVQNNYFGKGVTGTYDRGMFVSVANPQSQFHTYSIDWNPNSLVWSIDGKVVRTLRAVDCKDDAHQYPQSPSKIQIGLWAAGLSNPGTVAWAGGATDLSKAPFSMRVRRVSITNANPAAAYNWTDKSGSWKSIQKLTQLPGSSSSKTSVTSSATSIAKTTEISHPQPAGTGSVTTSTSVHNTGSTAATGTSKSTSTSSPNVNNASSSSAKSSSTSTASVHPSSSDPKPQADSSKGTSSSSGSSTCTSTSTNPGTSSSYPSSTTTSKSPNTASSASVPPNVPGRCSQRQLPPWRHPFFRWSPHVNWR